LVSFELLPKLLLDPMRIKTVSIIVNLFNKVDAFRFLL